jgi:hypothetical protein
MFPFGSKAALNFRNDSPCRYVDPKQIHGRNASFGDLQDVDGQSVLSENEDDPRDSDLDEDGRSDRGNSSEQEGGPGSGELRIEQDMARLGGVETKPSSRDSDLSEQENEDRRSDQGNSSDQGGPESGEVSNSTEQDVAQLGGVETNSKPSSRDLDLLD